MSRKRTNELVAGVFVLACMAALFAVAVWLGGVRWGGAKTCLTIPLSEGNTGIQKGSYVYLGLLRIGAVENVRISGDGQDFLVDVRLDKGPDVYRDALVRAESPPLGGDAMLVFYSAGTPQAGAATAEQPIPIFLGASALVKDMAREAGFGPEQRTQFQQIITSLERTARNAEDISTAMQKEFTGSDAAMLAGLRGTVDTLRETAGLVRGIVTGLAGEFDPANAKGALAKTHRSLDDANQATADVREMLAQNRPKINTMVDDAAGAVAQIRQYTREDLAALLKQLRTAGDDLVVVMGNFRQVSADTRETVALNRDNIDQMLANLTQASANLKGATREIRSAPWKLLGKPTIEDIRSENIQNAARAFADGAAELDDALNRMQQVSATAGEAGEVNPDDPQLLEVRNRIKDAYLKFSQAEQALWKELAQ